MWCWSEVAHAAPGEGRGGGGGGHERQRKRQVKQSLQPWLVLSPSNEKDSLSPGPAWVSCLGTDARYLSICYSTTHQHTHTHILLPTLALCLCHTNLHFHTTASHTSFWPSSKRRQTNLSSLLERNKGKKEKCFHSFGHCGHQLWQHYSALLQQSHTGQEKKLSGDQTGYERANRLAKIWKWVNFKFFVIFIVLN